jgi:hypothetical protein
MTSTRRWRPIRRDDGGYVLPLTVLMIIPLFLFTGFAVDLGSWTAHASRAQAASDAAALAGVVYLPDRPDLAVTKAREAAARNGFADGVDGVTVTVEPSSRNELRVAIFDPNVKQYFSSVFVQSPTIERGATAEFIRPVPMGSPEPWAGQDPERGINPAYVLNVAGVATRKENGDKRTAKNCWRSHAGCDPTNADHYNNADYSEDGYYFTVSVDESHPVGEPLRIEVYDPAYVYNNDTCGANTLSDAQRNTLHSNHGASDPFLLQRYQNNRSIWCVGDQRLSQPANRGSSIKTTYIVRGPDDTPTDVTNNPAVCAITFDPWGDPTRGSNAWPAGMSNIFDLLNDNTPRGREELVFRDHYRKWFPVCTIPAGSVVEGDYILQIRTNADLSNPRRNITGGLNGDLGSLGNADLRLDGGHNRYNLRAGFGADLSNPAPSTYQGVSLAGLGHLPIYMNQQGSVGEFFLARILPETAGKTLQLTFWDMADIGGQSAAFELVSPPDATVPLDDCSFSRDGGPTVGATVSGCTITGITQPNYNGRNVIVRIPIPADYDCAVADPLGCWTKVRVDVTSGGSVTDTTTWSATMTGDPVRLIR